MRSSTTCDAREHVTSLGACTNTISSTFERRAFAVRTPCERMTGTGLSLGVCLALRQLCNGGHTYVDALWLWYALGVYTVSTCFDVSHCNQLASLIPKLARSSSCEQSRSQNAINCRYLSGMLGAPSCNRTQRVTSKAPRSRVQVVVTCHKADF